jgi:hypothetical protein
LSQVYLYRRGDGNEGNFPRNWVRLAEGQCPYAALVALVANDYRAGCYTRRFIMANLETDGEPDYGIGATVHEGPQGEQAFGAAWLTAELEPYTDEEFARSPGLFALSLRDSLDRAAWRFYRRQCAKGAQ